MFKESFCRYEFKFPVSYDGMDRMLDDLAPYTQTDSYANAFGYYSLSSIYFDNADNRCCRETLEGVSYRQKIRLRVYRSVGTTAAAGDGAAAGAGRPAADEPVDAQSQAFFEIKAKVDGLVMKRRTGIKLGPAMELIRMTEERLAGMEAAAPAASAVSAAAASAFAAPVAAVAPASPRDAIAWIQTEENERALRALGASNPQVLKEIQYIILTEQLHPRNVVSYERMALFARDDPELRITFDVNIRTRGDHLDLMQGTAGRPSCGKDIAILELKTGGELPLWLVQIIAKYGYRNQTFSKYCSYYVNMLPERALYGEYVAAMGKAADQ